MIRTTGFISSLALSILLIGCTKQETLENIPGTATLGHAKIANVFVRAQDGAAGYPDYPFTLHCGPDMPADGDGRLMLDPGGCTSASSIQIDKVCFQLHTDYWLLAAHGCNTALHFNFESGFNASQLTSALVRFEPSTCTWEVPNAVRGFNWSTWDMTQRPLPRCMAQNLATS